MNVREWALPVYTILMQLAIGALGTLWTIRFVFRSKYSEEQLERLVRNPIAVILITVIAAMIGSFFHLSRPYLAFVAIFNFANSWLSREITFTVSAFICIALLWYFQANVEGHMRVKTRLGWAGFLFGLGAIFCMSRIYILPTQASWDNAYTTLSFYVSMIILGSAASLTMMVIDIRYSQIQAPETVGDRPQIIRSSMTGISVMSASSAAMILALYVYLMNNLNAGDVTAKASLELYLGLYQPLFIFRLVVMLAGSIWMIISVARIRREKISLPQFGD